ncbi:MAG: penicillin-binding protein 2 [Candidatus Zambryskibacteria bacterium]|nr:penicillin-binding protein 2 [Candidatus Zambryskibacteria bacterium]
MSSSFSVSRIRFLSFLILFVAGVIIIRLYILQVTENDTYLEKADRQYARSATSIFNRSAIFFTSKTGELVSGATLKTGFTVAVNPQILKNPEGVFEKLNPLVPLEKSDFLTKATKQNDPYEEVAKRLDYTVGEQVDALQIPGVRLYKDRWRYYPGNGLAARTLGFLAFKGDEYAGRYGLERFYEDTLKRGVGTEVNFFAQIFSNIGKKAGDASEGDVVTSIEPTVQTYLEKTIDDVNKKYSSEYTGGIIVDPKTGVIYAMALSPGFDLNNTKTEKDVSVFSNPLVEAVYEMGSIIKPLTVAAGIDTGTITANTTYYDNGFVIVNNKKISNFDGKARGVTTIQTALSESLNTGMAYIVGQIGNKTLETYMYKFGLNERTNIDLPNEAKNLVSNLESPRDIEHVTASFGQGIALSPISTVRALSTLANGGYLIHPHVATKINYKIGISKDISFAPGEQVIKKETAEEVTRMMVRSVDEYLRGGKLKLPNYSVAVKTGTAQIARNGKYSEDDFLHSFIGYFPAYNPRFLVFLYTVKPRGVRYGSESLSEPFMDTVKFLVNYYEIPPDR